MPESFMTSLRSYLEHCLASIKFEELGAETVREQLSHAKLTRWLPDCKTLQNIASTLKYFILRRLR